MNFRRLRRWATRCALTTAGGAALVWWVLPFTVALPERLLTEPAASPTYLASDGTPLRKLLTETGDRVSNAVTYQGLPSHLIHAILAAEDKRFFHHGGIDLLAVGRATYQNLSQGRVVSGASTLTQQLIKTSTEGSRKRSFLTKATEALQARRLEMSWEKERILTAYLNRVSFGNLLTGVASAAEGYLNKPLSDLSPAECAFLVSLPQSPTRLNPFRNLVAVQARQQRILASMHAQGWLTEEAYELAQHEKLVLQRHTGGFAAPHAVSLAGKHLVPDASNVIRTTIMPNLQNRVESVISRRLKLLDGKHVTQAAAVVLENRTGRILALAGSRDFFARDGGQINGAWAPHSPGSSVKPFTYLLALQRGYSACTIIPDLPVEYATANGIYRPENYDGKNYGPVPLRTALGSSLNIPAVRLLDEIGGPGTLYEALKTLGISTLDNTPQHYGLGLTIGNAPVRLVELVNAYACLARLGDWMPWTLQRQADTEEPPERTLLYPASLSYIMADMLSDNAARVLTFGPHSVIRLPFRCAVKTGTSTGYRDNWAVGYTPEYTVGVWVGNFDNTPMNQVTGVTGAGPIFRDIFTYLQETMGAGATWYPQPDDVITALVDPRNGRMIGTGVPQARTTRQEVFVKGGTPPSAQPGDYEATTGKAYIPRIYSDWLGEGRQWLSELVAIRPDTHEPAPTIVSPTNGSVFILDPDLREQGSRLVLRAGGGSQLLWSSPTLPLVKEDGATYLQLKPGQHEVTLLNELSGESITSSFQVKPAPTLRDRLRSAAESHQQP